MFLSSASTAPACNHTAGMRWCISADRVVVSRALAFLHPAQADNCNAGNTTSRRWICLCAPEAMHTARYAQAQAQLNPQHRHTCSDQDGSRLQRVCQVAAELMRVHGNWVSVEHSPGVLHRCKCISSICVNRVRVLVGCCSRLDHFAPCADTLVQELRQHDRLHRHAQCLVWNPSTTALRESTKHASRQLKCSHNPLQESSRNCRRGTHQQSHLRWSCVLGTLPLHQ